MKNQNSKFKIAAVVALAILIISLPSPRANAGTYLGTGALVGAIVGGTGTGLGIYFSDSCADAEEKSDCEGLRAMASITFGLAGTFVGCFVGAGIGALIKKEPKVTIAPTISPNQNGGATYGLGINGRF